MPTIVAAAEYGEKPRRFALGKKRYPDVFGTENRAFRRKRRKWRHTQRIFGAARKQIAAIVCWPEAIVRDEVSAKFWS
jgi:hypothetical protein